MFDGRFCSIGILMLEVVFIVINIVYVINLSFYSLCL